MAENYTGMAIGVFELDSECICFVALDAAAKAAAVKIQAVERNRLGAGACVKMRGTVSDVKAGNSPSAGKDYFPYSDRCSLGRYRDSDCNDDRKVEV